MISRQLQSTKNAAGIFFLAIFLLYIGSINILTSWPGQEIFQVFFDPSVKQFINVFSGYSLLISGLFWASQPTLRSQQLVFCVWPIATIFLWLISHQVISIGWFGDSNFDFVGLLGLGMAMPAMVALIWRLFLTRNKSESSFETNLRWLFILMVLFALVPPSALRLTTSLHPLTFDIFALKFDAAAGFDISPWLFDLAINIPGLSNLLELAYGFTPLALFAVSILQLRGYPKHLPNALLVWVVMTICALLAYHLFPITGPKYLFGSSDYIAKLQSPDNLLLEMTGGVGPNPRNGMPSMHFGWMLTATILWWQSETGRSSRVVMLLMTICVALATLYLGEHYVIDLIVAVPFTLAAIALTTSGVPFTCPQRWRTVLLGFGCWLGWVLLLRNQITFFLDHPWACWVITGMTALIVMAQAYAMADFPRIASIESGAKAEMTSTRGNRELTKRMGLMFFASGAAALIYQVLFAKELALVFGSTATATFTVLATFLGGMAIGSLVGGVLAARVARPIAAYAMVELAIAGFCVLTPTLFATLQGVYVFLAADVPPASPVLLLLRVALGASVLLVPTVLMGITLPLLAQALNPSGRQLGGSIAWLYACNTAGAALGALLTSYLVIPMVGAHSTTLIAAMMNLLVALGALELAKRPVVTSETPANDSVTDYYELSSATQIGGRWVLTGAWLALGLGGVLSLGLEVVYVHLLSIVAGNSVYAFGLMLATFLIGLALGGEAGRRLLAYAHADRAAWLALAQLGLAAAVALGAWGWDMIPAYFASFADYPLVTSFQSREAVRAIVCALVMIPPTVCIGLSYTLAMDLATTATRRRGITMLGWSAAINTLGNIVGVLVFGFVLLPWLGGLVTARIIGLCAMGIAAVVATSIVSSRTRRWVGMSGAVVALLVWVSPTRLDYEMLSSGANVYFVPQNWGKVIDHAESIDGGLTTVTRRGDGAQQVTTLLTNGKFQGNDASQGEVQAQIGFAALPLLHQSRRDNALVIGYGTGATSRVFYDACFGHIDIAELSRDVVALADAYFPRTNSRVSGLPGVQTHITDGRNFLLLTRRNYDVISIEITSIWFAGAASLYNREFYQLARAKLRQDGVLQQWVQLHHMAPTDLLTIIGTLRGEFTYVSLYVVGGQGILIATNDAAKSQPSSLTLTALDTSVKLQPVRALAGRTFAAIAGDLLLTPAQVDLFLDKVGIDRSLWISTDNNLRLEYSTPKANASPPDRSFQINMKLLTSITNDHGLAGNASQATQ